MWSVKSLDGLLGIERRLFCLCFFLFVVFFLCELSISVGCEDIVPREDFAHVADADAVGVVVGEHLGEEGDDVVLRCLLGREVEGLFAVVGLDGLEDVAQWHFAVVVGVDGDVAEGHDAVSSEGWDALLLFIDGFNNEALVAS